MRYLLIPIFLLSGCTGFNQWYAERSAQNILTTYGPRCEAMGHAKGTRENAMCAEQLHAQESARAANMGATGLYMMQQSQPRPMTYTTCSRMGNFVNCNTQ